jgi:hypothetical protein
MATLQINPRGGASDITTLIAYKAAFRRTDGIHRGKPKAGDAEHRAN